MNKHPGVAVILPWHTRICPYRELNLDWVFQQWWGAGYEVNVGRLDSDEPWCKAKAVQSGVGQTSSEIHTHAGRRRAATIQ